MLDAIRSDISVLTATPDLIAQGLVPELIGRLAANRVRVIGAMPYAFSAPAAADLYRGRITHNRNESRVHSGWLNPQMFTAGSSLILYLGSDDPNLVLVDFIREIKGGSRMGERDAHQLRSLSPITDRGFSLVHSPDDLDGVSHELGLVLGDRGIAELLDPVRLPPRAKEVVAILSFVPLSAETHPFAILPRVIAQVAAMCACAPMNRGVAGPASRLFERAQACQREIEADKIDHLSDRKLWSSMARLESSVSDLIQAQRNQIDWTLQALDLRRSFKTADVLLGVASACLEDRFSVMECEALIDALSACHLSPSVWDKHRLRLIAAYHRRTPSA